MTLLLNVSLAILAAGAFLATVYFLLRALQARHRVSRQAYGFGQQAARRQMQWSLLKALVAAIVAMLTLAVFSAALVPQALEPLADQVLVTGTTVPTPSRTSTPVMTPTRAPVSTRDLSTATSTPRPTSPIPTLPPTATPTASATPSATPLPTAIVNSPNGLYLREAPGGSQEVELIADGAILTLLSGQEQAGDFVWQYVRTQVGNEGWVAIDFLLLPGAPELLLTQAAADAAETEAAGVE